MIFIRQTTGIYKMCMRTAKFFGFLIHHIDKIGLCTADIFCNLGTNLIRRLDIGSKPAVLHRHLLAQLGIDITAVPGHITNSRLCKCHDIFRRTVLNCYQKCHQFRCTCRIPAFIHSLVIENCSCICIDQNRCLRSGLWPCRPALDIVGCDCCRSTVCSNGSCLYRCRKRQNQSTSQRSYLAYSFFHCITSV